ncbi:MAG: malonyl-CoA decarboxylase family protein [Acetobacteraceae bacterium]|nr:malonyl-CoA decarboxylase family protein [Acetobacteraceae bacterium]
MEAATVQEGLFDRALKRLLGAWAAVAGAAQDEADIAGQMRACLEAKGGEVSARGRSAQLAQAYRKADAEGRTAFLRTLAGFDADPAAVQAACAAFAAATDPGERAAALAALRRAATAPRVRLLTQFTSIPEGVKFLVDLRADLMARAKDEPLLAALDEDLRGLLAAWFDVGFLELRRIDWNSPASLLEKLVGYEAVHEIRGWRDLKNRLDADRRCYAFFHPAMAGEPLIFVEVALVRGLADNVRALLDEKAPVIDPQAADTAIFYSISNCQRGLSGISFGNFLIKQVVDRLSRDLPNLKTFATLSPIPGFRRWLEERIAAGDELLTPEEGAALAEALAAAQNGEGAGQAEEASPLARLLVRRHWHREPALVEAAKPPLLRLCARYLLAESDRRGKARDPVAHFHLSNGARAERLNWLADASEKGLRESLGLMVNYLYDRDTIEANHELYAAEGKRAASSAMRRLARG